MSENVFSRKDHVPAISKNLTNSYLHEMCHRTPKVLKFHVYLWKISI